MATQTRSKRSEMVTLVSPGRRRLEDSSEDCGERVQLDSVQSALYDCEQESSFLTQTGGLREYSLSDVEAVAAQIAEKVPAGEYEISLGKLMTGDDYFKFVYVATEDPLLTSINNICRELVTNNSVYDEAPFIPHMSLAYSPNPGLADAVAARCRELVPGLRARVGSVVVAECDMDKSVRHWRVVSCWSFSG